MVAEKKTKKKTVKKAVKKTAKKAVKKVAKTVAKMSAKKAVAKKAEGSPVAKKASKKTPKIYHKPLTSKQLEKFQQILLVKRREIVGDVDSMRNEALDSNRQESSGDLSNMPIHMADIGTDNYEQEFTLGLIESERKQLFAIDRALNKIKDGSYGVCEGTGESIKISRLEAAPEARYCFDYARKIEQGLVVPDENAYDNAKANSG